MQQQLLDVDVPPQIKSKMAMLTKALEQFMSMDPDALEAWSDEKGKSVEGSQDGSDLEKQFSTIEEEDVDEVEKFEMLSSTRETSYSFEDLVAEGEEGEGNYDGEEELEDEEYECYEEEEEEEKSTCEVNEIKSEKQLQHEAEKKKKNEKIQTLQKSWQKLCDNQKTIHK